MGGRQDSSSRAADSKVGACIPETRLGDATEGGERGRTRRTESEDSEEGSGDDPTYTPERSVSKRTLRSAMTTPAVNLAVRRRGGLVGPRHGGGVALWVVGSLARRRGVRGRRAPLSGSPP